jgi:hypothetical protein
MLETVIKNSPITRGNINSMSPPQSVQQYTKLTIEVMKNQDWREYNVAHIIRSLADQFKYDIKLERLATEEFGFSTLTRIFHSKQLL